MKTWNGQDNYGNYQYPLEDVADWNMMIDESGNVYYIAHDGSSEIRIWCTARELTAHLHHLEQIKARR